MGNEETRRFLANKKDHNEAMGKMAVIIGSREPDGLRVRGWGKWEKGARGD